MVAGAPGGPMRTAQAPAPSGTITTSSVRDTAALSEVIHQLAVRLEVKETKAMIAASDSLASFRVLSFPRELTQQKIDALVHAQLPSDGSRMGIQQVDVTVNGSERTVFALAFDRPKVQALAAAVRQAGLEPTVVEIKSLCIARIAPQPSCIVVDLTDEPAEAFLIDRSLPRLWHTFKVDGDGAGESVKRLSAGLAVLVGFYRRLAGGGELGPDVPALIASEQPGAPFPLTALEQQVGRPVRSMPLPPRVAADFSHGPYLACLGLLMRRR